MKTLKTLFAILILVGMTNCSGNNEGEAGGNSVENTLSEGKSLGNTLELPFEIDGIEAPKGKPMPEDRKGLTSLGHPEFLGNYVHEGFEIMLVVGADANEQDAVHAISLKAGKKVDEKMLCTYYEMEPYGTDVVVEGSKIQLRNFSYAVDGKKTFWEEGGIEVREGIFSE